ncbi:MAG: hypothetical protein HC796_00330 [Synechococcaceae cyanobacterium RL_1_2]|nr:hypothetical protein [Synechococcaceae cyanobacterium RL_1_2]
MGNQSHYQEEQAISDLLSLLSDPNLNLGDSSAQTLTPGEQSADHLQPTSSPSGENPIAPHRDRSSNFKNFNSSNSSNGSNSSQDFLPSTDQTDGETLPADVMAALNTVMPPVEKNSIARCSNPKPNSSPSDPSPVLPPLTHRLDDSSSVNLLEEEDLSAIDPHLLTSPEPRADLPQATLESEGQAPLTQHLPLESPTNGVNGEESVDETIERLLQTPKLPTLPTVDPINPDPIPDLLPSRPTVGTANPPPGANQEPVDATTYQLQNLLTELIFPDREADALKIKEQADLIYRLEKELNRVQTQLNDPQEMIELLLPLIADLLSLKITESRDDVIRAIGPIIDQLITTKTHQDKVAMINAIAEIVPGAISKKISDNPAEIVQSIAPAMGESIRAQILLERDSMVNALYPVIGDTIKKYMKEWVDKINQQLENSLTIEGLQRKIKAKIKGVPEMNLIMRETMPFFINAIFLIHKESGLIIAEAQREGEGLEGDMLAGMLTAIRSFASECTVSESTTSELKEIEYETFSILMEVAGYYYTAVVIEGDYTSDFLDEMRRTLSTIVLNFHSPAMKDYDGDPDSVPKPVHNLIENLLNYQEEQEKQEKRFPWAFLGLGGWGLSFRNGAFRLATLSPSPGPTL